MSLLISIIAMFTIAVAAIVNSSRPPLPFCNYTQNPGNVETNHASVRCTASELDNEDFTTLLLALPIDIRNLEVRPLRGRNVFDMSQDFRRFTKLETLKLNHGSMQVFGESIFAHGAIIEHIDVSNNYLSHLTQRTFSDTRLLKVLNLSNNRLGKTGVPSGAFARLGNLEKLDLANNGLHSLSHSVFAGLANVTDLDLSGNSISATLEASLFAHNPLLRSLKLDRCGIAKLPRDLFRYLPRLEVLSLSGNRLTEIPHPAILPLATRLRSINLGENLIKSVPSHHFEDWRLERVDLSNNKLQKGIDPYAFHRSSLIDIDLSGNQLNYGDLECLRPVAKNLERLAVSFNPLMFVNYDFFTIFRNLKEFEIAGTGIANLPTMHLPFHENLRFLNISHNRLFAIKSDFFTSMGHLEVLDLSNNRFENFDNLAFGTKLSKLHLARNPWHCSCRTFAFRELLTEFNQSEATDIPKVTCASPAQVSGKSIIDLKPGAVPTCSAILGAIGLTDRSELGVLVTVGGAVLLVLVLVAVVVGVCLVQRRRRPGSAMNVSRGSSELQGGSNDDIVLQAVSPLAESEKSPPLEHKPFILEVEL